MAVIEYIPTRPSTKPERRESVRKPNYKYQFPTPPPTDPLQKRPRISQRMKLPQNNIGKLRNRRRSRRVSRSHRRSRKVSRRHRSRSRRVSRRHRSSRRVSKY